MSEARARWTATVLLAAAAVMAPGAPAVRADGLRDFNTDRPDTTESPFTIDRGHAQIELSLAEWTRDRADGATTTSWSVAPFNLRWGINDRAEVDLIAEPYGSERVRARGATLASTSGRGDVTLRLKWNLWGDDGAPTAFALLPYLTLPTASRGRDSGHVEGGLVLPFDMKLAGGFDLSTMLVLDLPRNQDNDGYAPDLVHSVSLGHDLGHGLGGYVELAGFYSPQHDQSYRATFDSGVTLACGDNAQVDAGFRLGLTRATDDLALFAGVAFRF